jgi:hypothetical protein
MLILIRGKLPLGVRPLQASALDMIPIRAGQSLENVADENVHFDQGFP